MAKPKNYDEAVAQFDAKKTAIAEAKAELRKFKTEKGIKRNKPVEDEKVATQLEKKEKAIETLREQADALKATIKELKPRKSRTLKYEYPADCTTDVDKKKYRTKMRREAKKAEKGEDEKAGSGDDKAKKKVVKKSVKKPVKDEDED